MPRGGSAARALRDGARRARRRRSSPSSRTCGLDELRHRRPSSTRWPMSAPSDDLWLHVDGAYGGAALAAPERARPCSPASSAPTPSSSIRTSGSSRRYDCCALLYRRPGARAARPTRSTPGYLDAAAASGDEWNPSDYAVHLTRRARGLPFWFSLAAHGTDAYPPPIERTLSRRPLRRGRRSRPAPTSSCCASRISRSSSSGGVGWDAGPLLRLVGAAAHTRTSPS